MSDKEVIEQKISFFKMLFFAVLAIFVSLCSYVATHLKDGDPLIISVTIGLLIFFLYVIIEIFRTIFKLINKLKDF